MTDLICKPKPGRIITPGALIDARGLMGRIRQVRVLSIAADGRSVEAWDSISGRPRRVWLQTCATARKDVPAQLDAGELARNA